MTRRAVPVIVLAGFLGSGKTTVLNHLLRSGGGTRIGAVVNDFGSIEIDAMVIAGQVDSTVSLGNGCLCCAVDGSELDVYLERLTRPSSRIDVIVIEASGLAEPQELVRMILASENPDVMYGGLVEVVDAAEFEAVRERHPEIDRHLGISDLVVLNKTDRAGEDRLERITGHVTACAPGTPVVRAEYGRVDPELLFEPRPSTERVGQLSFEDLFRDDGGTGEHGHGHGDGDGDGHEHGDGHAAHLHSAYDSRAFTSAEPMSPRRLMDFFDTRPDGLYRVKGYIDFGTADPRNKYAVHAVGRFLRFSPEPWAEGEERGTQLVLIGSGIDAATLAKALDACKDAPDAVADEHSMWGVLRYVREPE
ncbi:GTP-binding protein [Streptomyces sp. GC420]|uniref:CobW family GTP-binding protein n=1 Tax=Streptomyces sp. GC420 TaxID=2697568 RepID=UPI00141518FF|nr:CobW family GTP-binding protein [Streptomyces sp. GC420]NBM14167.1 GTP-binding protein [Streptomyces sp. GC420]